MAVMTVKLMFVYLMLQHMTANPIFFFYLAAVVEEKLNLVIYDNGNKKKWSVPFTGDLACQLL